MIKSVSYNLMSIVAALLLAMTSVGSASRLAPSDMDRAEVVAFLAMGGTLVDLCEDEPTHVHAELCPFCNTVSQAGNIAPAAKIWTLTLDPLLLTLAGLALGEQRHANQRFARGPPTAA